MLEEECQNQVQSSQQLNPSTSEPVGSSPGGWTQRPLKWKAEGLAGWYHMDSWPLGRGQPELQPEALHKRSLSQWPPSSPGLQQGWAQETPAWVASTSGLSAHQDLARVLSHDSLKVTSSPRKPIWLAKDNTKTRWIRKRWQAWKKGEKIWTKGNMEQSIFYSSFTSCSGTVHSFPLCSFHIDADSTETGLKSDMSALQAPSSFLPSSSTQPDQGAGALMPTVIKPCLYFLPRNCHN